jgi:hypothetical protein
MADENNFPASIEKTIGAKKGVQPAREKTNRIEPAG